MVAMTTLARVAIVGAALLLLSGCAAAGAGTSASDEPTKAGASGETFGCTDAQLAFLPEHGYPDPEPQDPSTLSIHDGVTLAVVPDCLVVDQFDGAPRYAAFFATDIHTDLDAALTSAGYVQSPDYGANLWMLGGTDPTTAEHAVGYGIADVGGTSAYWFTY